MNINDIYFYDKAYDIIKKSYYYVSPINTIYKHISVLRLLYVCIEQYDKSGKWCYMKAGAKSLKLLYSLIAIDMISRAEAKIIINKLRGPYKDNMKRYLYKMMNFND